jgi:hypothetical protein
LTWKHKPQTPKWNENLINLDAFKWHMKCRSSCNTKSMWVQTPPDHTCWPTHHIG